MPSFINRLFGSPGLRRTDNSTADEGNPDRANGIFAFKLLKRIASDQPRANIFISPFSVSIALQMVANGAAGQTKAEMEQVLEMGIGTTTANEANGRVANSLKNCNSNVILEIANSIWYRQDTGVRSEFLALIQEFFDAIVKPIDFTDPHSADIINSWASEKTHGRITRIADGLIDPVYGRMILANAVYFNGKWSDPFDSRHTDDRPFNLQNGAKKDIPMMSLSKRFTYQEVPGYQAVRLPYKGENLAMYVLLPAKNWTPEKLLTVMDGDSWRQTIKPGFIEQNGDLILPKFKLEYGVQLVQPLQKLGMRTAFAMEKADFSEISSEPLFHISAVLQKTFVEVKEEGTEAAAVTVVAAAAGCVRSGPPPKRFQMIVDRPFLLLIEDNQTGTILFMGLIYDPAS